MAEEFANFMQETKKAPLEEKLNTFGDIVEKMMSMILRIPDLVDQSLASRINSINNDVSALRTRGTGAAPVIAAPSAPSSAPPPPGGPPGGPPPPPGGRPPPGGPGGARPASPVSLRGAIMGELKSLFAKRKTD